MVCKIKIILSSYYNVILYIDLTKHYDRSTIENLVRNTSFSNIRIKLETHIRTKTIDTYNKSHLHKSEI